MNKKQSTEPNLNVVGLSMFTPNHRGITLIALIITIIVMLILVAVTVSIAINENLLGITKSGAKGLTIEGYKENLEPIRVNAMMEQIKNELTTAEFMDKVEEGIKASTVFKGSTIIKTSKSVKLTTKEEYVFRITERRVAYIGTVKEEEEGIMNLTEENTSFIYDPEGWTKGKVQVSIETILEEETGGILQYSLDEGNTWTTYTKAIEITENGKAIYARLWDEEKGKAGTYVNKNVTNIDTLSPKQFTPTGTSTCDSITLTGNTSDADATPTSGSSGIKAYYYSIDNGQTWVPQNGTLETSYTFKGLSEGKTYSGLKMKVVDKVENETITSSITVTTKTYRSNTTATEYSGSSGTTYQIPIIGSNTGTVWGTDIYTDDSNIAKAAVHAGIVNIGEKKIVTIEILSGQSSYKGSTKNGISSSDFGEWPRSFRFVN